MIHRLTQVVLSVLGFPEFSLQCLQTVFTALQKAYTFHVRHAIAFLVVNAIRQVDLM